MAAFGAVPAAEQAVRRRCCRSPDETVVSGAAITFKGAVAYYLGLLAALLGRTAAAASHLEQSIAIHDRLGAASWSLRSRYQLATVHLGGPDAAQPGTPRSRGAGAPRRGAGRPGRGGQRGAARSA